MSTFITRVELHGATEADYKTLHAEMARRKFSRTIRSDSGVSFHLPTAEYYSFGEITASYVRDLAISAAKVTGLPCWVLVSDFNEAAWLLVPV